MYKASHTSNVLCIKSENPHLTDSEPLTILKQNSKHLNEIAEEDASRLLR
jgi:hypothetical protein